MDILKMLKDSPAIEQIGEKLGLDTSSVDNVLKNSIPEIGKAITKNTSSEDGLSSFIGALKDHDSDDVDSMIKNIGNVDTEDGSKIISHILGGEQESILSGISNKTGVSSGGISSIWSMIAPILMGFLGKQSKSSGGGFDISSILSGVLGSPKGLVGMLDKDNDGSVLDDLGDMAGKLFGK